MIGRRTIYLFLTLSVALHLGAAVVLMDRDASRPSARQLPVNTMQVHLLVTPPQPRVTRPEKSESKPHRKSERNTERVNKPKPVRHRPVQQENASPESTHPQQVAAQAAINKRVKMQDTAPVIDEVQRRNQYLSNLLAHIDKHKYYPRIARRRGLEGVIKVSFILLPGGEVRQLQAGGDNRILRQAASATVRASLPLPLPPEGVSLPMTISFGMQYRLD
jgi:protein TonB